MMHVFANLIYINRFVESEILQHYFKSDQILLFIFGVEFSVIKYRLLREFQALRCL